MSVRWCYMVIDNDCCVKMCIDRPDNVLVSEAVSKKRLKGDELAILKMEKLPKRQKRVASIPVVYVYRADPSGFSAVVDESVPMFSVPIGEAVIPRNQKRYAVTLCDYVCGTVALTTM